MQSQSSKKCKNAFFAVNCGMITNTKKNFLDIFENSIVQVIMIVLFLMIATEIIALSHREAILRSTYYVGYILLNVSYSTVLLKSWKSTDLTILRISLIITIRISLIIFLFG